MPQNRDQFCDPEMHHLRFQLHLKLELLNFDKNINTLVLRTFYKYSAHHSNT